MSRRHNAHRKTGSFGSKLNYRPSTQRQHGSATVTIVCNDRTGFSNTLIYRHLTTYSIGRAMSSSPRGDRDGIIRFNILCSVQNDGKLSGLAFMVRKQAKTQSESYGPEGDMAWAVTSDLKTKTHLKRTWGYVRHWHLCKSAAILPIRYTCTVLPYGDDYRIALQRSRLLILPREIGNFDVSQMTSFMAFYQH